MNFLLVGITFLVLAAVIIGCAVLGTERLFPGRKTLEFIAADGVTAGEPGEMPILLSERPQGEELKRIRFSTALTGYNKDEVDAVLQKLVAENARLRSAAEPALGAKHRASSSPEGL